MIKSRCAHGGSIAAVYTQMAATQKQGEGRFSKKHCRKLKFWDAAPLNAQKIQNYCSSATRGHSAQNSKLEQQLLEKRENAAVGWFGYICAKGFSVHAYVRAYMAIFNFSIENWSSISEFTSVRWSKYIFSRGWLYDEDCGKYSVMNFFIFSITSISV